MPGPELTAAIIADAMERATAAICPPLDDNCHGLSYRATRPFAECTLKGWCFIGWVLRDSGRESWDACYNVFTREGACVGSRT
jgi:hypothetical protein